MNSGLVNGCGENQMSAKHYVFRCKDCGFEEVEVEYERTTRDNIMFILPCHCGMGKKGVAAIITYYDKDIFISRGPLVKEHLIPHFSYQIARIPCLYC